jgi:hypothetical protein
MMKARLLNILVLCLLVSSIALAATVSGYVTPGSLGQDLSVEVDRDADGLLAFTVVFTLKEPQRGMAELAVRDSKRTLATSDTPFSKGVNTFRFSIAPDLGATSEFTLDLWSDVPIPPPGGGGVQYRMHLMEFVPPELLPPQDGG